MEAVRLATPEDVPALAALAAEARAELAPQRGGAIWEAQDARVVPVEPLFEAQVRRAAADGCAVVGTIDGTAVGYGVSTIEHLSDDTTISVVSDLFVAPGARGVGVGEAMMDLLVAHARAQGARGIDALALPGDRETKNFFETFGLKARAIVVHRALDGDA